MITNNEFDFVCCCLYENEKCGRGFEHCCSLHQQQQHDSYIDFQIPFFEISVPPPLTDIPVADIPCSSLKQEYKEFSATTATATTDNHLDNDHKTDGLQFSATATTTTSATTDNHFDNDHKTDGLLPLLTPLQQKSILRVIKNLERKQQTKRNHTPAQEAASLIKNSTQMKRLCQNMIASRQARRRKQELIRDLYYKAVDQMSEQQQLVAQLTELENQHKQTLKELDQTFIDVAFMMQQQMSSSLSPLSSFLMPRNDDD